MLNLNIKPYFDDFSESKGFYRVLYRPSVGVQARELNQMQSILQNQIARFGNHMFKNGAMIRPGGITFENDIEYVKLERFYGNTEINMNYFLGAKIKGAYSNVEAWVQNAVPYVETGKTSSDPPTLYVKITKGGSTFKKRHKLTPEGEYAVDAKGEYVYEDFEEFFTNFCDGEEIFVITNENIRAQVKVNGEKKTDPLEVAVIDTFTSSGYACGATIDEGIYFINGFFANVQKQNIIIDRYNNKPTVKIGLRLYDHIVTPEEDASLHDNAQGSYNYSAPGAHRYKLDLKLETVPYVSNATEDTNYVPTKEGDHFIMLMCVVDGEVTYEVERTEYAEIERTLARRTYDESGDYTVTPFMLSTYEHYRDENDPRYTSGKWFFDDPVHPGDKKKIAIQMSPGKAYVKGYEIKKIANSWIEADKALDTNLKQNEMVTSTMGSYVFVTRLFSLPHVNKLQPVELFSNDITVDGDQGTRNKIGTARVRAIELDAHAQDQQTHIYKLYLTDVDMVSPWTFNEVNSIAGVGIGMSKSFTCSTNIDLNLYTDYVGYDHTLIDIGNGSNIIVAPEGCIATLNVGAGSGRTATDVAMTVQRVMDESTDSTTITLPIREGESYDLAPIRWLVYDTSVNNGEDGLIPLSLENGVIVNNTNTAVTVNLQRAPKNKNIRILAPVNKQECKAIRKTLMHYNHSQPLDNRGEIIANPAQRIEEDGKIYLAKCDGVALVCVWEMKAKDDEQAKKDGDVLVDGKFSMTAIENIDKYLKIAGDNCKNITDRFVFNGGQTDTIYGNAYLTMGSGYNPPEGPIIVSYTYFEHGAGDYISVDSYYKYPFIEESGNAVKMDRFEIPAYTFQNGRGTINLADCIDFRPCVNRYDGAITAMSLYPNSSVIFDYEYYLGRIDIVYINTLGKFGIARGVPGKVPAPPSLPSDAMGLWKLHYAPGTSTLSDIAREFIENKRYTMRDIGKLEKRIDNLEYYVALSLLEIQTLQMQITDTRGNTRFKNGFIVDPFNSHAFGERGHLDYRCSIDIEKQELRPTFATNFIDMKYNEKASAHVQKTSTLITLPYKSVPFVEQTQFSTTVNVNPFAVVYYGGVITLNPESDSWFEKTKVGVKNIDYSPYYDALNTMADKLWDGEHWGDWYLTGSVSNTVTDVSTDTSVSRSNLGTTTEKVGSSSNTTYSNWETTSKKTTNKTKSQYFSKSELDKMVKNGDVKKEALAKTHYPNGGGGRLTVNVKKTKKEQERTATTTTVDQYEHTQRTLVSELTATTTTDTTTTVNDYARDGWAGSHNDVVTQTDFGDRTVGINDIQYMRERDILCKAKMMMPNTQVYPFFDDVAVGEYCQPDAVFEIKEGSMFIPKDAPTNITGEQLNGAYFHTGDTVEEILSPFPGDRGNIMTLEQFKIAHPDSDCGIITSSSYKMKNKIDENTKEIVYDKDGNPVKEFSYSQIRVNQWQYCMRGGDKSLQHKFSEGMTLYGTKSWCQCTIAKAPTLEECGIGGDLWTDQNGCCSFMFYLPCNETHKFKTGERTLVLNDQINNTEASLTKAQGKYISRGYNLHTEGTIVHTKSIQLSSTPIHDTKQETVVTSKSNTSYSMSQNVEENKTQSTQKSQTTSTENRTKVNKKKHEKWHDPLAQSFLVPMELEGGAFITAISVCFARVDEEQPIRMQIIEMQNGIPTQNILPYSVVVKQPEECQVLTQKQAMEMGPNDPIPWTRFEMEAPVYLMDNEEYALFLICANTGYEVWCATMDQTDMRTKEYISKQPYDGVIFKSQNSSTWSEDQMQDMCFMVERAVFDISQEGAFIADNEPRDIAPEAYVNSIESFKGTNHIRIHHPDNGLWKGAQVRIDDIDAYEDGDESKPLLYNGLKGSSIKGVHTVEQAELDSFLIKLGTGSGVANDTGRIAEAFPSLDTNLPFDVFNPNISHLVFEGTGIEWGYRFTTGCSVGSPLQVSMDGGTAPQMRMPHGGYYDMLMEEDNYLDEHGCILSVSNKTQEMVNEEDWSLRFRGVLTSDRDNLSPVIDLTKCGTVLVNNRVDFPRFQEVYPTIKFEQNSEWATVDFSGCDNFTNILVDGAMIYFDASEAEGDFIVTEEYDLISGNIIKSSLEENLNPTLFPVNDPDAESGNGIAPSGSPNGRKQPSNMYGYKLEKWYPITRINENTVKIPLPGKASATANINLKNPAPNFQNLYNIGPEQCKFIVSNTHHRYVPESEPLGASTASRYFTKCVTVENPSAALKVMFTASCEAECDFEIWLRTLSPYSTEYFDDIHWWRVRDASFIKKISVNSEDFHDYECTLEFTDGNGLAQYSEFTKISMKIVMVSENQTKVPKFKNLRLICLGT